MECSPYCNYLDVLHNMTEPEIIDPVPIYRYRELERIYLNATLVNQNP